MKFVLYGRYDPKTYVTVYMATDIGGCSFEYLELDCDPVLVAFSDGQEIASMGDMALVEDWVNDLVFSEDCEETTL